MDPGTKGLAFGERKVPAGASKVPAAIWLVIVWSKRFAAARCTVGSSALTSTGGGTGVWV